MKQTLYKKDVKGNIRVWSVEVDYDTLLITHGQLHGSMQHKIETISRGLQGRTVEQQAAHRARSRINKQKDQGYVEDLEAARSSAVSNTLGLPLPMLAQRYDRVNVPLAYYVQRKYDGNRCLIANQAGTITAYSRQGKPIGSIDHIVSAAEGIPEGMVLDGELYHHGTPLQTIRSWVSRKQPSSEKLTFVCYDHLGAAGYAERLAELEKLGLDHPIVLAETVLLAGAEATSVALSGRMRAARAEGYEGLILRAIDGKYEPGKRSKHLIKLKTGMLDGVPIEQEEFLVLDVDESKDGWAILVCSCTHGTFRVSAPGSMDEKYEVARNRLKYIGSLVTVEFSEYTPDGIPFHPVAIAFRRVGE